MNTLIRFPYKEIPEFIQREWSKIGVKMLIETTDYPTLLELTAQARINFFRASWYGDYPDPENFLAIYYSKNFSPGGANKTRYKNPEFDKLYEQTLTVQDQKERNTLYQKMDQIATNDAPMIILFYDDVVRLMQKKVVGLDATAMNNLVLERVDFK